MQVKEMIIARSVTRIILLTVFGLVLGLIVCEVTLRVAGISYPIFDTWDYDRAIALRPHKKGWYRNEGAAHLEINGLGYRDRDHPQKKNRDELRIAFIGDSFTEARQVEIDKTFWRLIENSKLLTDAHPGYKVITLNFGIGGYGTVQEYITLKRDVLHLDPDLVVLMLFMGNDFINNSPKLSRVAYDDFRPFYELKSGNLQADNSFRNLTLTNVRKRFLLEASHHLRLLELVNQVRRVFAASRVEDAPRNEPIDFDGMPGIFSGHFVPPKSEAWQMAWNLTEAVLEKAVADVRQSGAEFLLVAIPTPMQVHPEPKEARAIQTQAGLEDLLYPDRRLAAHAQRFGYAFLSLTEPFIDEVATTGTYLHGFENHLGIGHWNENGHAIAARAILASIIKNGLLPPKQHSVPPKSN
ncbi:MAG: SGNH/GDSL hydrolase family protein [Hyphomicrobiaceae bacterium]